MLPHETNILECFDRILKQQLEYKKCICQRENDEAHECSSGDADKNEFTKQATIRKRVTIELNENNNE